MEIESNEEVKKDYNGVLDFLQKHGGELYKGPKKRLKNEDEYFKNLQKEGQASRNKLAEIAELDEIKNVLDLFKDNINNWVDQGQHIPNYLWLQLKKKGYRDEDKDGKDEHNPISISIFAEKGEKVAHYRVSLEIYNKNADKNQMKQYHSHLDIPRDVEDGLVYVSGSNEHGNPVILDEDETQDEIRQRVESGEKVQICKYIYKPNKSYNSKELDFYYQKEIIKAVKALVPYYNHVLGIDGSSFSEEENALPQKVKDVNKDFDKNLILYGPPGTGKTYNSAKYAVAICDKKSVDELIDYEAVMSKYNELKESGRISFTTFHQSYGYEEFIEGIKPVMDNDSKDISYTIEPGIFKKFCDVARNYKKDEPCVFIIDEINRGNISKIFGELITLIESTKRDGMEEAVSATLPYSGKTFSVPSNVYILGTMNTADRSIALMDTALRRRFQFIEMMPDSNVLRDIDADKVGNLDVASMLDKINERITFLYDREHTIGHAFFTGLKDNPSLEKLQSIFEKSVIPLLQEYFYEDYQKIQLVLGDNAKSDDSLKFILDEKVVAKDIFKGNVEEVIDLPEKKYSINKKAFSNINSYKEIL
ncbi:McrB family protein [Ligilactobacillus ruminis]|uniref:McrB family protein n=1 Tax=Ligilactobacillus ruminis TaxID=1623 RepID=UPI003D0664A4